MAMMRSIVWAVLAMMITAACSAQAPPTPPAARPVAAAPRWEWSYDPAGPCHATRVDAHVVPPPRDCPVGYIERLDSATTAYCADGYCRCTNEIDCAHAKQFAWGCLGGTKTPWLPMRGRMCVLAGQ
jgi:hypothetical protein